jgi:UDP-N-acetylmuramoyl-L-alanyl-D-glutamate--2,6-diaminopimelate ligase
MDRLRRLLSVVATRGPLERVVVESVTADSRAVEPGALFVCIPGRRVDGHDYAEEASARGAVALVVERPLEVALPQVVVAPGTARQALGRLAAELYGRPSERLAVVGVTGTNGKTTVTWLLRGIAERAGRRALAIGTLTQRLTTPEAPELEAKLAQAASEGVEVVAMEVSSHGLALGRVEGVRFAVSVFTNLGRDHLDFHGDMERYFEAKASLFAPQRTRLGVVNVDDPYGRRLAGQAAIPVVPVSLASVTVCAPGGCLELHWRGHLVRTRLLGAFNAMNALLAAEAAVAIGIEPEAVAVGLEGASGPPGRFERFEGAGRTVVVDYAHTPDALRAVLGAARSLGQPLVAVFGCGGGRDRGKRPEMGRVAATMADAVVVTTDNPRDEDPAAIAAEVVAGTRGVGTASVEVILDRLEAIRRGLERAGEGGTVVVAGKGHEATIERGGVLEPFDDREVCLRLLAELFEGHPLRTSR